MSVTCSVSLVNWNEFTATVAQQPEWSEAAIIALAQRFPSEPLLDDSKPREREFLERLDELQLRCASPSTAPCASVFNALFWTERSTEYRIMDVDCGKDPFRPESIWGPASLRHFATLWSRVRLEEFREAFQPALGEHVAFSDFEEFQEYAQDWGSIIFRGSSRGCGLITFTWG